MAAAFLYVSKCVSVSGCEKLVLLACIQLKLENDPLVTRMLLGCSSLVVVVAAAASDTKLRRTIKPCQVQLRAN